MAFWDIFNKKNQNNLNNKSSNKESIDSKSSLGLYADSKSVADDERGYYQPDEYYTYYSYPGTEMARKVVTFEERKKNSYPSKKGLYVAEILLLEYCNLGKYPKPKSGYPGFWWFKYGIRDIGHALESLKDRGFIQLSSTKKDTNDLKYELTDLGKEEIEQNGYVIYMHKHRYATTEDERFGKVFNVWSINKLFPDGDAKSWRQIVGNIEKKQFGVNMAQEVIDIKNKISKENNESVFSRDEMRNYLKSQQDFISKEILRGGDGFLEESKGISYKSIGKDKEALVQFFIAIGKKFDAPALYRESAILLRKYKMYEEELFVIDAGMERIPENSKHYGDLSIRKEKVVALINKEG